MLLLVTALVLIIVLARWFHRGVVWTLLQLLTAMVHARLVPWRAAGTITITIIVIGLPLTWLILRRGCGRVRLTRTDHGWLGRLLPLAIGPLRILAGRLTDLARLRRVVRMCLVYGRPGIHDLTGMSLAVFGGRWIVAGSRIEIILASVGPSA